jgi:methanogenic corrinoid protein MtbC1
MLAPALASIGDKWASGELSVEQEHLASAVASRLIGRLGPRFARRGRPRGTIVTAMPPGERHGFGVSMLADVLRGAGYSVLDLGPDTPIESLLAATRRVERLSAVCLSVAFDDALPAAAEMIAAARSEIGPDVPIVIGGRAVREDTADGLGADIWSDDPTGVVRLVESFPAEPDAATG